MVNREISIEESVVVVGVYCHGCDVRASVATVYVTFIEWGQGGVGTPEPIS